MTIKVQKGQTYTLGETNPSFLVFSECFTPPLLNQVCFSLSWDPQFPTQVQLCVSYDSSQECFGVDFSDFACIPIGLDDLGLEVCFDNWNVQASQVCFNITFKICALFCVTVYSAGPICIPTGALSDDRAKKLSAGDAAKLRKILEIQRRAALKSSSHAGCGCK